MLADFNIFFIDTNIFLRVLVRENEKVLAECLAFLELVKNNKIAAYTNSLVLAEIDWVMESVYKIKKESVIEDLKSIVKLKGLRFYEECDYLLAVQLYEQYNIKFIDALIAANRLIQKQQAIIVSYDKDFNKIKGVKKMEPKQVLKKYG